MEQAVSYEPLAWGVLALAVAVGLYRLRYGVYLWVVLAGTFLLPLVRVRSAVVLLCTAYLTALLGIWALSQLRRGKLPVERSILNLPLLVFAIVAVLSCLQGLLFRDPSTPGLHRFTSVQIYATALVLLSIGAAVLVGNVVTGRDALRRLWWCIVAAGVVVMSTPLGLPYTAPRWWPIIAAHVCMLLYARLLYDPPRSSWLRGIAAGLILYMLMHVVVVPFVTPHQGQWLSGWAMLLLPLGLLTIVRLDRRVLAALFVLGIVSLYFVYPLIRDAVFAAKWEGDFGRLFIWEDSLRIWRVRPLLGVGPGNYMDYAERYARGPIAFASAHANYQQLLAEVGIIGLTVFLWVIVRALVLGVRLFLETGDPFLRAFTLGVLATLGGQLVASTLGDYIVPAYHNGGHTNVAATIYVWILIGALISIERSQAAGRAASPDGCPAGK